MLYPSLQELTNKEINHYSLVIAVAKGARLITENAIREREEAELRRDNDRFAKDGKFEITADSVNDKAVTRAVEKIYNAELKIILPEQK